METINPEYVDGIFRDCLFKDEELAESSKSNGEPPEGAVLVEGVVQKFGFHPERLNSYADVIEDMLKLLPTEFRQSGGGGWSFLNACNDRHGHLWTGEHRIMEQLLCLGIGVGKAKWQLPKELWSALPGGMPYVVILD